MGAQGMRSEHVVPTKLRTAPSVRQAMFIEEVWSSDGRSRDERSTGHLPTPSTIDYRWEGDGRRSENLDGQRRWDDSRKRWLWYIW